ncbi:MAG: hypothetical protein HY554_01940, partial [Elusimicrobia bacterium]|nr:hypothetical protein [Elusimicrobiota bacterium]
RLAPEQFLMRDLALDEFLRAQEAYDAEVLKTFDSPLVKGDRALAVSLNALYDLGSVLRRQQDHARFGRGMAAIDALILLEEGRLAALRYERASLAALRPVALVLRHLQETKERWRGDPKGLSPLYAVTEVAEDGRRLWNAKDWVTSERVAELRKAGRVQESLEGGERRLFVLPAPGETGGRRLELIGGVDAAEDSRDGAKSALHDNGVQLQLHETLSAHEFALTGFDGRVSRGLSHLELLKQGAVGRTFHFSLSEDPRTRLHPALQPLEALSLRPDHARTVLYLGQEPLSREQFPTWESLLEHRERLARSADPKDVEEAGKFLLVRAGEKGAEALIGYARASEERSLRAGWTMVKLQGHGFAVDGAGDLAELFVSAKEFEAYRKALQAAPETLARARAAVAPARSASEGARAAADARRAEADAEYGRLAARQAEVRADLAKGKRLSGDELKAAVLRDGRLRAAQKAYDQRVQAAETAGAGAADALRAFEQAEQAVTDAELLVTRSRSWSLFASRDVSLGLDETGAIVQVSGQPVFGGRPLDARIGAAQGAVRQLAGELYAAELAEDGRALKLFADKGEVEKAGERWTIEEVNERRWADGGRTIDPNFRLSHYVDPETGRPVLLNRRFMLERLEDAQDRAGSARRWGLQPWHWVDLALEIPRGLAKTPVELFTGRDLRQEHFLGRKNLHKLEGGLTERHGLARRALGALDILDLMPDPVTFVFDPSQFPAKVVLDGAIGPGRNIQGNDARAGDKDVHFGRKHLERTARYADEDLANAKTRVFTYFEGGVRTATLEKRRGRDGFFETSSVREERGAEAVTAALRRPAVAGAAASGEDLIVGGQPRHIEVESVRQRLSVRPGAKQQNAVAERLRSFAREHAGRRDLERAAAEPLGKDAAESQARFDGSLARRDAAAEAAARLWDQQHELSWRIGRQNAVEADLERTRRELERGRESLRQARERLRELED